MCTDPGEQPDLIPSDPDNTEQPSTSPDAPDIKPDDNPDKPDDNLDLMIVNPEEPVTSRRRAIRAMARGIKYEGLNISFANVYNGSSIYMSDNDYTRFFIDAKPEDLGDVELTIKYNSRDITDQLDMETMSFVLPALTSNSTLEIIAKVETGVDEIIADPINENTPIFDLTGTMVGYGPDALGNLPAGIYIVAGKKVVVK